MKEDKPYTLETLHECLTAARRILDHAATEIRMIPLEPRKEHIKAIGSAISEICDICAAIYDERPEMRPKFLNSKPEYPGLNRAFGELVVKVGDLVESMEFDEARALIDRFLERRPPKFYEDLAKHELHRLNMIEGED